MHHTYYDPTQSIHSVRYLDQYLAEEEHDTNDVQEMLAFLAILTATLLMLFVVILF